MPRLPAKRAEVTKQSSMKSTSRPVIPPYTNTRANTGKLDTITRNMVTRAAPSFPDTISQEFKPVVSIRSRLSRSPLMVPEVMAGMINISMTNSMVATNSYRSRKLLYWTSAVSRT